MFLHEDTGCFSFYGLNAEQNRYEPFLSGKDPRTSFIELNVNGRINRLGESSAFRLRTESSGISPAFVFESKTLLVRQEFTFIQTVGSPEINGIRMTIRLTNLQSRQAKISARIVLNTIQGPEPGEIPFFINNQRLGAETIIAGTIDRCWVFRGESLSFLGNIGAVSGENPVYLCIGSWNQLSKAVKTSAGRKDKNTNTRINSIENPAVCYYYDLKQIPPKEEITYSVLLAVEDSGGINSVNLIPVVPPPSTGSSVQTDSILLDYIISRLDQYSNGEIEISDEELAVMEQTINRIKSTYNDP
ncbi:MAG: hypothetical protein LBH43_03885 [Treponema sp.]|nr:hypothetical protein [Treponema sp.]